MEFDSELIETDSYLSRKHYSLTATDKKIEAAMRQLAYYNERLMELMAEYGKRREAFMAEYAAAEVRREKRWEKKAKQLEKANDELRSQLSLKTKTFDSLELEAIAKARTIAIFESILFAIENWATDDVPASDFTPVAQAILFKAVYDPVMTSVNDYYLNEIPFAAHEVVKRGREYVKGIRSESQVPLTDQRVMAAEYQDWWVNDALVLLYGDRDPDWEVTKPYSREEMELWKSTDMDKTMHFPRIFDAFELTRKYGDEIRETSGLPDFTKQIMQTRLTAHE